VLGTGLASAVEQLAWERDLDLSTGLTPVPKDMDLKKLGSDIKLTDVDSNLSVFKSDSYQGSWIGDFDHVHEDTIKIFKAPDKAKDEDVMKDPLIKDMLETKPQKHGFVNTLDSAVTSTDIDCFDDETEVIHSEMPVPIIRVAHPSLDGTPGGHSLDSSTSADSRRDLIQEEKRKKKPHKKSKKSLEQKRHSPYWSKRAKVENFDSRETSPERPNPVKQEEVSEERSASAFPAKPMGSMSSLLKAWDDDDDDGL
jgi:hypothetical protein